MTIFRIIIVAYNLFLITTNIPAQITQRPWPPEWKNFVHSGRFMARFLTMTDTGRYTDQVWGVRGVRPRYIDNGIEHPAWSLWGGNIIYGEDGKYHLYACGWPENSPGGHSYGPKSIVFNAVSENSFGPFLKTEKSDNDMIVTFDGAGLDFPDDEFSAKLLGKTKNGKLFFGYSRFPWIEFIEPILSPGLHVFTRDEKGFGIDVEVENFGQVASIKTGLKIVHIKDKTEITIAEGKVPPLQPFEKQIISLKCGNIFDKRTGYTIKVIVNPDKDFPSELTDKAIPFK